MFLYLLYQPPPPGYTPSCGVTVSSAQDELPCCGGNQFDDVTLVLEFFMIRVARLLASSGECVLLAPTTCLLVCEVLPSSMCLGLIPGPVLTALLHRSWATSYTALHTLWALAAFSLQSWFQNQLQVRPLGPSLPAGSDMSSIMVLSTLPQCHAWERDHRTLHNIRTVTDDNEFLQTRKREGTTQTRAR